MLFQQFINQQRASKASEKGIQLNQVSSNLTAKNTISLLTYALIFSLGLSACSSRVDDTDEQLENPTIEQTDAVNTDGDSTNAIDLNDADSTATEAIAITPARNLYSEQQANSTLVISDSVLSDYQKAISLMKDKKWSQANALFDKVIVNQPQLSGSYVNKGIIAKQQGELDQALVLLNKAIEINSLNLYAHHEQGQVYRRLGQFDKAEQSYLAALAMWPNFAEAHVSMAILLELYRGRLVDAYNYYRSYLILIPNDDEVKRWQAGLGIKIKRAGLDIPPVPKAKEPLVTVSDSEGLNNEALKENAEGRTEAITEKSIKEDAKEKVEVIDEPKTSSSDTKEGDDG